MQYQRLGKTGLVVSRICLGMMSYGDPQWRAWVLTEEAGRPIVQKAVEAGINFFDTANGYSNGASEEVTGRYLREFFTRRDEYVLTSKVFFPVGDKPNQGGLSRKHIFDSVNDSLRRLNTEYIDLYQIHRWDPNTPIEETMEALHDVVKSGKVRYLGASSMYAWQFATAQFTAALHGWTQFVSMQNHYNLIYREEEREMIPLTQSMGVGLIPWSPLARGFLAGNRTRENGGETTRAQTDTLADAFYYTDTDFDIVDRLKVVAARVGKSPAQVALAWMLHKPYITAPIIGATKLYQLDDALEAMEIKLTPEDMQELEELYKPRAIAGHS
jgi:1-deoxyxylulose-5-phosphate synthase